MLVQNDDTHQIIRVFEYNVEWDEFNTKSRIKQNKLDLIGQKCFLLNGIQSFSMETSYDQKMEIRGIRIDCYMLIEQERKHIAFNIDNFLYDYQFRNVISNNGYKKLIHKGDVVGLVLDIQLSQEVQKSKFSFQEKTIIFREQQRTLMNLIEFKIEEFINQEEQITNCLLKPQERYGGQSEIMQHLENTAKIDEILTLHQTQDKVSTSHNLSLIEQFLKVIMDQEVKEHILDDWI